MRASLLLDSCCLPVSIDDNPSTDSQIFLFVAQKVLTKLFGVTLPRPPLQGAYAMLVDLTDNNVPYEALHVCLFFISDLIFK